MASTTDVSRCSSVKSSWFDGILDPRVERILWHLEDDTKKNVVDELAFDMDLEEMMEARESMFVAIIKSKAFQDGVEQQVGPSSRTIVAMYPKSTRPVAFPWRLIKRRVPSIAAGDMCDLYAYSLDPSMGFPTKMLKKKALNLMGDDSFKEILPLDAIIEQPTELVNLTPSQGVNDTMQETVHITPQQNGISDQENGFSSTNLLLPSNEVKGSLESLKSDAVSPP